MGCVRNCFSPARQRGKAAALSGHGVNCAPAYLGHGECVLNDWP